MYKNSYE